MHAVPLKLQRKKKEKEKKKCYCVRGTLYYNDLPLTHSEQRSWQPLSFSGTPCSHSHTCTHSNLLQYNLLAAEQLQWPPCEKFKAFLRGSSGMGKCLFHFVHPNSSHQSGTWTGPLIQSLKLAGYIFLWCSMLFYCVQWCEMCCATVYYVEIYLSVNIYGCYVFWGYMVLQRPSTHKSNEEGCFGILVLRRHYWAANVRGLACWK